MTEQQETKKEVPKKKRKSLLHNPDRARTRKNLKTKMKREMAPEIKKIKSTSLDEVLK
jgi:hypothetical protein